MDDVRTQERRQSSIAFLLKNLATVAKNLRAASAKDADREHLDKALRVLVDTAGHASTMIWKPRMVGEHGWRLCPLGECRRKQKPRCRVCNGTGHRCAR